LYNELYKVWKAEKTSEHPQPLPSDFYNRSAAYMKGVNEIRASNNVNAMQGRLALREKQVAERLLEEIKMARLQKIADSSLKGKPINLHDLTDNEKTLAESLKAFAATFSELRIQSVGVESSTAGMELTIVRFLEDAPEVVGVDMKIYGPYKKEDVGSLPKQNADVFVKQGVAKPIGAK
jgi:DNA replication initiation complex subunit (GINS family)